MVAHVVRDADEDGAAGDPDAEVLGLSEGDERTY